MLLYLSFLWLIICTFRIIYQIEFQYQNPSYQPLEFRKYLSFLFILETIPLLFIVIFLFVQSKFKFLIIPIIALLVIKFTSKISRNRAVSQLTDKLMTGEDWKHDRKTTLETARSMIDLKIRNREIE